MKFSGPKLLPYQRVVFEETYSQLRLQALRKGRSRSPAWLARALSDAETDAMCAAIAAVPPHIAAASEAQGAPPSGMSILDKPTFKLQPKPVKRDIFASVVKGENAPSFRTLELLARTMCEQAVTDHILLVGPPSVGKTMTATILARAIERPLLPLSGETLGDDLHGVIQGPLTQMFNGAPFSESYRHPDNQMVVNRVKPTTIFVDEVHAMPTGIQTSMLMATEGDHRVPLEKGGYIDFQDVLFIFGTTEPQLLNKPLKTRFTNINMVHYSAESIAEMIRNKYPSVTYADAEFLARCSKLYPREALRYAKQMLETGLTAHNYAAQFFGADERGIDATDRKLLAVLESTFKHKNPQQVRVAQAILADPEKFTAIQVAKADALINTNELKPMFLNALADKLMLTNSDEVRARVHYLETLGLVLRTGSGVIRQTS